jgi:hypothetical protein
MKTVTTQLLLVCTALTALALSSCNAIADTSALTLTPETVWIRLVPSVAVEGKATLVLDFSKPIDGLTNETSAADLESLFTFANGEGMSGAEAITAASITKDSDAVYRLTVEQVPDVEAGIVLVTITKAGIAPPTRAWSLDGELYEISLSRTDGGGILDSASPFSFPEALTGYAPPELGVTVSNVGSAPTGALNITLSGDDAGNFNLSPITLESITVGGALESAFTVQPKGGLSEGDYAALVTVRGEHGIVQSFMLNFAVVSPPLWSHNKEPLDELSAYYVSNYGRGDKDGRDWDNAVNNKKLYDVLEKAAARGSSVAVKVYVAGGTYIPWNTQSDDAPTLSATSTFTLASNVAVYGGFANRLSGTVSAADQSAREARFNTADVDVGASRGYGTIKAELAATYETILSGDLSGDDSYDPATGFLDANYTDNAYNVVTVPAGTGASAKLDGFTIRGGNAEYQSEAEDYTSGAGGGICSIASELSPSSPAFARLTITGNRANECGGGIYNEHSSPSVTCVTVTSNWVYFNGGGIGNDYNSSPTLSYVTITNNEVCSGGGGIWNSNYSHATLSNVTIAGNKAGIVGANGGGGMYNYESSPILSNVVIKDNHAYGEWGFGGGMQNWQSSPILSNVVITGNTADSDHDPFSGPGPGGGGGIFNYQSSPVLTNVVITGNTASVGAGAGIYNYLFSSPILTNVLIAGNQALITGGGIYNCLVGSPILTNVTIAGNRAGTTGGGMHTEDTSAPVVKNSIFWGNSAATSGPNVSNFDTDVPTWAYSLVEGSGGSNNIGGNWDTAFGADGDNNIAADPQFVTQPPASAAPTNIGDYRLQAGSPAVNTGSNTSYDSQSMPADWTSKTGFTWPYPKDLAGNTRKVGIIDMGSYEK